ncbi:HNH endonuclease signature motif containing protein [Mycolicibacterium sp. PO1]
MSEVGSAVAAIRDGIAELAAAPIDTLTHPELIALLNDIKTLSWSLPAVQHPILARLMTETEPQTLGAKSWEDILTIALRLSKTEATRTIRDTHMLGPRRSLDGQPLPPHCNNLAAAQAQGRIGPAHLDTIAEFFRTLPHWIDVGTRADAETQLARSACGLDPDQLRQAAQRLALTLDPDGPVPDEKEQHRKRGLTIGRQQPDGMSRISGYLTPEARACWDALAAKLAAPGTPHPDHNPSNSHPADTDTETGSTGSGSPQEPTNGQAGASDHAAETPTGPQTRNDTRSTAQRNHDAFLAMTRMLLSSNQLGTHNGLPVTVIVSTTLQELSRAAGVDITGTGPRLGGRTTHAVTAGGTLLPMADLIRMATPAHHYLAIYDQHTNEALYLGRTKRLATPAQRIVLLNRDRGCTRPGCTTPGYHTQAHHAVADWNNNGHNNINDLTLACGPDNRAATHGGWTTRKRPDGRTEWHPPPALDTGQTRINNYHHPERYLIPDEGAGNDDGRADSEDEEVP